MGGAYDKAHAHYAFVAAAIVLLAISWHVSTSPSSLAADSPAFAAAVDVLERAAAAPLPGVALALVVGPGLPAPRDGAWASLELSWPEHVRLASARHWDGARDRGLPASPAAVVPAVDPWSGAPGTFELVAGCWSSLGPALVLGASRRAWAFLPCDGPSADLPSAVAAVGRALGAAVFDVSAAAAERGGSFGVGPTAEGLFYVASFELAIEGPSGTGRWAFGDAAAALLSPALARLAPALRLRVTSRVTPTAPLAAAPLAASAAVPPAPVYDFESLPPRVATLGDLASALVHGPAASLAPRDQFPSGAVLMYTLAVLPHSNRPPLVLRSSERNGHGGFTASVLHVDDPYSTTVVVLRPMNASVEGADGAGLPAASLAPVFAAFLGRLRGGLGLPPASHCPAGSGVLTSCLLPSEGFRGWEVDRVARDVAQRCVTCGPGLLETVPLRRVRSFRKHEPLLFVH